MTAEKKPSPMRHYVVSIKGNPDVIVEAYQKNTALIFMANKVGSVRMATHKEMLDAGRNGTEVLTCRLPAQTDALDSNDD